MKVKLFALTLVMVLVTTLALGPLGTYKTAQAEGAAPDAAPLLSNIPVTGTLSDGGSFVGRLSITDFASNAGALEVRGVLRGDATKADGSTSRVRQSFSGISLIPSAGQRACDILNLDLGPLNLDLLGLVVELDQVVLDITGATGDGKLLGNLLCAVAGLLDPQ